MNDPAIQTKTCPVCGQVFRTTYPEKIYCDYTCYVKARNRRKYLSKKDRRRKERKC